MFVSKFFPLQFFQNETAAEEEEENRGAAEIQSFYGNSFRKPIFNPEKSCQPLPPAPVRVKSKDDDDLEEEMFPPFTFPMEVWNLIIERMDGDAWKALSQTCSALHSKVSYVAAENVEIIPDYSASKDWEALETSTFMKDLQVSANDATIKKLWITESLKTYTRLPISSILSRIVHCNLKELKVQFNKLTWEEYLKLTNSGSIEILSLEGVDITYSETNENVPVQDVLSRVQGAAYDIYIQPCHTDFDTPLSLRALKFKRQILYLALIDISIRVTSPSFFDFLVKNASPYVSVLLRINRQYENRFANNVLKRHFNAIFNNNQPNKMASLRFA